MKFLLGTQILSWAGGQPDRLSAAARKLLAQAIGEGITQVTADAQMARYAGPVRKV